MSVAEYVMQSQALKMFLSIFFGAFVGGTIALELDKPFWWIGALTGGAVGYLSYEWKEVVAAIPKAWKVVKMWESPRVDFQVWFWSTLACSNLISWNLCLFGFYLPSFAFWLKVFAGGLCIICMITFPAAFTNANRTGETPASWKQSAIQFFPPVVLFYHLPRGIIWLAPRAPGFVRDIVLFIACFVRELIRLINSDARIICGAYAMIGAVAGYFYGYAAVGALLAAFVGALHDLFIRHYRPEWRRIE